MLFRSQYLKIYERISEYLFAVRVTEEKQKKQAEIEIDKQLASIAAQSSEQEKLQDEIKTILDETPQQVTEIVEVEETIKIVESKPQAIEKSAEDVQEKKELYNLQKNETKTKARVENSTKRISPPKMASKKAKAIVSAFLDIMNSAEKSEDLLSQILAKLVDSGPFQKSALIVVSKDRTKALVVAARGPNIGNGQELDISDPLNPLAQCFSKVQSFGNKKNKCSPFGSKSFALAPIDADHTTPVALYADCGNEGSISFDARRVFRTVVEILNEKLPNIPGGIPVEL